jgi:hypothetical protein
MEDHEIGHPGGLDNNRVTTDDAKVQGRSMSAGADISPQTGREIKSISRNIASEQGKITADAARFGQSEYQDGTSRKYI